MDEYESRLDILVEHFAQFKRLEVDEPEIAEKLGFAGYVNIVTMEFYSNERHEQLEEIVKLAKAIKDR